MDIPKVILCDSFVADYFRSREGAGIADNADKNVSTILLDDSNTESNDSSVVFVSESTATRDMQKQAKMSGKLLAMKQKNRELKNRLERLERNGEKTPIDDSAVEPQEISASSTKSDNTESTLNDSESEQTTDDRGYDGDEEGDDVMIVEPPEINELLNALDVTYNETFLNQQLDQWQQTGELSVVFDEFQQYLIDLNKTE